MGIFHKKVDINVLTKAIAYLEEGHEVSPRLSDVPDYVLEPLDFFAPDYEYLKHHDKMQEKGITPDMMDMDDIRTMFTFFNRGERFSYGFTASIINDGELLSVYRRLKELSAPGKSKVTKSLSGILFIILLFATLCPIYAYAAPNNPELNTIDAFPAVGEPADMMEKNSGTITTLYDGGMVEKNEGHIATVSGGTVAENHGSIETLSSGHVGTNSGTIENIQNTGTLGVNDAEGKINYVGMGNEIDRNYGEIKDNSGEISENYGRIVDNHGMVTMHGGTIENNCQNGRITFIHKISGSGPIPPSGTVKSNKGTVTVHGGTVKIEENTGDIEVSNATITVDRNSGKITVGDNATLICLDNMTDGLITKTSESAVITCDLNSGRIYDKTAVYYQIVFTGDDGKAAVDACDYENGGIYYTMAGSDVVFTLPFGYICSDAMKFERGGVYYWLLTANPSEGDTEFTITCEKYSPCDTLGHTFGEWVTTEDATETKTGSKERTCSVCGYKETDTIPVLPHIHNGVLQNAVPETCTSSGVKAYYICSCHKVFEDASCNIEINNLNAWKSKGGNGYIAPYGHGFNTYISNKDATCTADGTKTATCENGCGETDTVADKGSAKGHSYGEWVIVKDPTLTETGIKEHTCSLCNAKETEEIPVLTYTSYNMVFGANSKWTKGGTDGLVFSSDAPFSKFMGVKIDGKTIESANYSAESGSTKITIFPACLETLSTGKHSVEIVSVDGAASVSFTIVRAGSSDNTQKEDREIAADQENQTDRADTAADKENPDDQLNPLDDGNNEDSPVQTKQNEPENQINPTKQPEPAEQPGTEEQPDNADKQSLTTQPEPSEAEPLQTDDSSHTLLLSTLLIVCGGAIVGAGIYIFIRKKR